MLILLEPFANARLIFPGDVGKKRIIIKDRDKYPITQTVNYRYVCAGDGIVFVRNI